MKGIVRMKILFDHQIFCDQVYGGVSRYHMELKKNMECFQNVNICIPVLFPINNYLKGYENRRIYSISNKWILRIIKAINRVYTIIQLKIHKFDVIHPTWHASYINSYARGRFVTTVHDMVHEIYYPEGLKDIERKKRSIYESTAIIAISENTKSDILRFYPDIDENKIRVIYHGTNYLPEPRKPITFKVPNKYILFVGKRAGYKNAEVLFKAFKRLKEDHSDIKMIMAGGGSFTIEEKVMIDNCEDIRQVVVTDAELAYLYQNAICFVYPSKYEGFGFPILEAFDNNCPVILSNTSCLPEVGGDAALYFTPDNEMELLSALEQLVMDDILRKEYIQKGAKQVKKFTWEKTAEETCKLYQDVLEGKFE